MRKTHLTLALLPFTLLPQTAVFPQRDLSRAISSIDAAASRELAKSGVGGVTIGVVSGPHLVWTKSYGFADLATKAPADQHSVYRIGSITKQLTGLMLLQLVERGKVKLSDPVERYFPEIKQVPGYAPVTFLQLATHTSGLDREPGDTATYTTGPVSGWEETLKAALPHTRFLYEPGTRFSYSNIGYAVLGAALARAAGTPYLAYMTKEILGPLNMGHTAFAPNAELVSKLTKGYVPRDGTSHATLAAQELRDGRGYKVPNGALFTTVADLARFVSFELGHGPESVLPRQVWLENLKRSTTTSGDLVSGYGIGFLVERRGDLVIHGHSGSVAGYYAGAYFHLPSQTGLIFLRNAIAPDFREDFIYGAFAALAAAK